MINFGKWSVPGVPHKGWSCLGVEDLGDDRMICEMCETVEIRYVHTMAHLEYPERLDCGCICAGHMEQDLAAARSREQDCKSQTRRRMAWEGRRWVLSRQGNETRQDRIYRFTVFRKGLGWAGSIANAVNNRVVFTEGVAETPQQVKAILYQAKQQLLGG